MREVRAEPQERSQEGWRTSFRAERYTIRLHTGDPGETGAHEINGGGYVPQATGMNVEGGRAVNINRVRFDNMPAATVTHFSLCDEKDMLVWGALNRGSHVNSGDTVMMRAGDITITVD